MTDRELLELAAKAAGLTWRSGIDDYDDLPNLYLLPWDAECRMQKWNPLTDDGDALRLAVKLGLPIDFDHSCGAVWAHNPWTGKVFHEPGTADFKGDPASMRRAITRAAAEIGRAMP